MRRIWSHLLGWFPRTQCKYYNQIIITTEEDLDAKRNPKNPSLWSLISQTFDYKQHFWTWSSFATIYVIDLSVLFIISVGLTVKNNFKYLGWNDFFEETEILKLSTTR